MAQLDSVVSYIKARAAEKDTHTVALAAVYTVARVFIPPQYVMIVDMIAGLFGVGIAATPNK